MKIRFTPVLLSIVLTHLGVPVARAAMLEVTQTVLSIDREVYARSEDVRTPTRHHPQLSVAVVVPGTAGGRCVTDGMSLGVHYRLQDHPQQYAYVKLPAGVLQEKQHGVYTVNTVVTAPEWDFSEAQVTIDEVWGSVICRDVTVSRSFVYASITGEPAGEFGSDATVSVDMDKRISILRRILVEDDIHLTQRTGARTIVHGDDRRYATFTSKDGPNQIQMRQKGGAGHFQIYYEPPNGTITWDSSYAPAGEYEGHATVTLDYP